MADIPSKENILIMDNKNFRQLFALPIILCLLVSGCNVTGNNHAEGKSADEISFTVNAIEYKEHNGDVSIKNDVVVKGGEAGWMQYEVDVPAAGRYKISLDGSTTEPVTCWVEDYIDNKDGRTYNITGNLVLTNNQPVVITGSPLNKGLHKIKLHVGKGNVSIQKMVFTLVKPHEVTPKSFKQETTGKDLVMTWSDEFDGKGLPDTSKWTYDIGDWGWGNNELQYYTANRVENARLEDGNLVIEARKNDNGMPWTSARLTTRGKESFLYGKIEFRAKVPVGRGTWSAGWLLGDEYVDELSWPYCGEVDILENVGYEFDAATGKSKTHASIHCGAYYFKLGNQPSKTVEVEKMDSEFHIYTAEWTPERISMFIDGKKYYDYTDNKTALSWPYNKAQNIILNLAMGGGWGGAKGVDSSLTSQKLIIDYVRVYGWK